MKHEILAALAAITLIGAPAAWAQPSTPSPDEKTTTDITGRVVRVDPNADVIVLEGGRMYRVTPNTVVYIDNQPATVRTVQPGQTVVIRSGERVIYQNGQYVVMQPSPTTVVVAPPASAPALRQTIYGTVADVDHAEIHVNTDGGDFDIKVPPEVARQVRKGDSIQLDVTIPAGAPSALPRTR